jgi:hypothetical protein
LLAETIAVIKSRIWANQGAAEVCESATVRRENPKQCTHDIFLYDELRRNGTLNVKACPTYFESHFSDRPSDKDANTCFLFEIGKKYFLVLPSKGDQALQVQVIAPPDSHVPPG